MAERTALFIVLLVLVPVFFLMFWPAVADASTLDHSALLNLNWDVAGHVLNDDLIPTAHNTYDLGDGTHLWNHTYTSNLGDWLSIPTNIHSRYLHLGPTTIPTVFDNGTIYYDQTNKTLYLYKEGIWTDLTAGAGVSDHSLLTNLGWASAGHTINADIVPTSIGTYELGNSSYYWNWTFSRKYRVIPLTRPSIGIADGDIYYDDGASVINKGLWVYQDGWEEIAYISDIPAGGLEYTELDGSDSTTASAQGAGDGAWVDWDISGIIPVDCNTVEVTILKLGATDDVGVRANGVALVREFNVLKFGHLTLTVKTDANRVIEIMSDDVSDADTFHIVGYWS